MKFSPKLLLILAAAATFSLVQPVKADRIAQAGPSHVESVPDGGSTMSLLGFALLGVAALRRNWVASPSFAAAENSTLAANHRFNLLPTKRFPLPRCASAIQIVRPSESTADTLTYLLPRSWGTVTVTLSVEVFPPLSTQVMVIV
jgi:VPDSG-CTERM motif